MTITLRPDQIAWLEAAVAEGRFPSVDAVVAHAIDVFIDEQAHDQSTDDPEWAAWAKPLIEEGLRDIEEGRVIRLDAFRERMAHRLARAERA